MILGRYSARSIKFGLYAYVNEPHIAVWNLTRFTETLLPLLNEDGDEAVSEAERQFQSRYEATFHRGISRRLELLSEPEGGLAACERSFRSYGSRRCGFHAYLQTPRKSAARQLFKEPSAFDAWSRKWCERLARVPAEVAFRKQVMNSSNPKFIPRNHRIEVMIKTCSPADRASTITAKPPPMPSTRKYATLWRPHSNEPSACSPSGATCWKGRHAGCSRPRRSTRLNLRR